MSISEWADWGLLNWSSRWLLMTELVCAVAAVLAAWSGVRHFRIKRGARSGQKIELGAWGPQVVVLCAAIITIWIVLDVRHRKSRLDQGHRKQGKCPA